ncbi:MAG: NAD(P)H-dependent oxidoreductase subunit E [Euryarchaeota archaeon]|nr:NAD(P)H-dependent oxidoreductase subunit E [Euryarchaeota archaeon]
MGEHTSVARLAGGLQRGGLLLLDVLHILQGRHGYLRREDLEELSRLSHLPREQIHGSASFYSNFRFQPPPPMRIGICGSLPCHLAGAPGLREAAEALAGKQPGIEVRTVSCLGLCDRAPAALINGCSMAPLHPRGLPAAVRKPKMAPAPAPQGLQEYMKKDGYAVLRRVLAENTPEGVISQLKESGLRGQGGAGYPAGAKWEAVHQAPGDEKYVVVNADEGEPGTFKDRILMEQWPHRVLEGALIAAATLRASHVYIYLREEYPRSRRVLQRAIGQVQARGWVAGPRQRPRPGRPALRLVIGAGAYICGEETALLESMEGRRGEPRLRPPFPATHGLRGQPTLVANVETLARVPGILREGAGVFRARGKNGAPGMKLFSLSGDIRRPGCYEMPLGSTARELIEGPGRGAPRGVKAFFPGGVATGFLPPEHLGTPLDYAPLARAGSGLGSGGVIVLSPQRCLVDVAENCMEFFAHESCGKCTPCRAGCEKMLAMLKGLRGGRGGDFPLWGELSRTMVDGSICGLGQTAPATVTLGLRHFPGEFEAHRRGECPAGVCFRK